MSVLNLSAHTLSYKEETGYRDFETGDYIKGETKWVEDYCACDIVPAGKANSIQIPDGTVETYSYTISNLPTTCREFQYGDKIRIKLYGNDYNRDKDFSFFALGDKWILSKDSMLGKKENEHKTYLVREFKVLGFHRYQLQCKLWV